MLLRHGLLMVMAGAIPGMAGVRLTGRFLESLIDGAKSIDTLTSRFGFVPCPCSDDEYLVCDAPH